MRLWITNASSRRAPFRGPGLVLSIMARPRPGYGEAGAGRVWALVPSAEDLEAVRCGAMSVELYRQCYLAGLRQPLQAGELTPGRLRFAPGLGPSGVGDRVVDDGATLVCACSRAAAAAGRCHRVWAATTLQAAGWAVVLDGQRLGRSLALFS